MQCNVMQIINVPAADGVTPSNVTWVGYTYNPIVTGQTIGLGVNVTNPVRTMTDVLHTAINTKY